MRSRLLIACLVTALCLGGLGCASTPKKQIRQPIHSDYSVGDPEFRNSINNLLGPPLVGGNNVVELLNGDQIFPAMLEAIRNARKTITLEQYIWSPGKLSSQFVAALSERARAGVKVYIITDAIGSAKLTESDLEPLLQAGAQFVRYNPAHWFRLFAVNHRTHRKLLVVDGRVGFAGGVCMADEWLGNAEPPNWRDTHFRVEGPVVAQIQAVFTDNWLLARSELLHGPDFFPAPATAGSITAQFYKSGPDDARENARVSYLLAIAAARKNIRLAHSYFVPSDLAIDTLMAARSRGVKIEVIVPAKSDSQVVGQAARSTWDKLLKAGVEFYEYEPTLYHPKIMIVDDLWVTAGSVNFDERSFRINDEANLNILDRNFAAQMIKTFEADKTKSRRLTAKDMRKVAWPVKWWRAFVGLFRSQL